jgi:hypothetical protein
MMAMRPANCMMGVTKPSSDHIMTLKDVKNKTKQVVAN